MHLYVPDYTYIESKQVLKKLIYNNKLKNLIVINDFHLAALFIVFLTPQSCTQIYDHFSIRIFNYISAIIPDCSIRHTRVSVNISSDLVRVSQTNILKILKC